MDAGEYETNTLVISNLSAVSYRIYEPIASKSSPYTFAAANVEDAFRRDGHLVYMDAVRRGIWCFYLSSGDPTVPEAERLGLHAMMEVCGFPLAAVKDAYLRPTDLVKNRPPGTNAMNTPSSSSSTGSALDMSMRNSQVASLPPTPIVLDGKAAPSAVIDAKYGSVPPREVHEFFITAILSSLTACFCRATGATLLNRRTVLLRSPAFNPGDADWSQPPRTSALATFRTYLTTTGCLIISLHVSLIHGLISSSDVLRSSLLSASPTVLAAPLGAFGTLQGIVDVDGQGPDSGFGQSPDTQVSRLRSEHSDRFLQWKALCCQLLQWRGMPPSLLDGCSWLNIHFFQRKPYEQKPDGKRTPLASSGPTAPWPAPLCFRKPRLETVMDLTFENTLSKTDAESVDPLDKAKVWAQGVPEREQSLTRRKKEREEALAQEHVGGDVRSHPQPHGYSPMTLWRTTNGVPPPGTGTIYPTPPDGVQPSGVTPSFEGAAMHSPAGQPSTSVAVDSHGAVQQGIPAPDGFNVGWEGAEPRPEQANNFSEDNIFGDLGENMFEGNELTDADFNFFDEQPGAVDLDIPMLEDIGSTAVEMQGDHTIGSEENALVAPSPENNQTNARISSPQFTKPELKHARSSLAEESRQQSNMESFNLNSAIGIKRHPSPFNPETIYKRIRASIRLPPPPPLPARRGLPPRRRSMFEKVDFDPALSLASKKYEESGAFDYRSSAFKDRESKTAQNEGPLTTGRLHCSARQRRNLKELPANIGTMLTRMVGGGANGDALSDSEDSSWASEDDDGNDPQARGSSPAKSSGFRRRPDDDVISMAASFKELDNMSADSPNYGPPDLSRLSIMEVPDFSLTKYFADPEQMPVRISVSDDDFVAVAQLLTEQAATGSLKLASQRPGSDIQDVRRALVKAIRYSNKCLQKALPRALSEAVGYQLRPFTEVQDVPLIVQPHGRVQMRPTDFPRPSIFPIPAPHVEVRRYENQLSVLPSAVSFWETLGLGPAQGPKDVVSLCIFPRSEGLRDNASAFLDRVQSTYESLRLGTFEKHPTVGNVTNGLVLLTADQDLISPGLNMTRTGSAFSSQMVNLALVLANSPMSDKNLVVYVAYEAENPTSIVESCAAFQELVENYRRYMADRKKPIPNALVLQLVSLDLVASESSLVVPSPSECARLCLETYDRCTLFGGSVPSPAIMLEKALPRGIEFKLTANASPDLLRENSCIHVAYARSVDERWATAAWTDNRGSNQTVASYCLGRRGKPLSRRLGEALHEIWETTLDLISTCKVHWRVIITRCGPMDPQEVELWTSMAQAETRASVSLVLLTVDTDPSLQLIPPAAAIPLSAPSAFYSTPVSTPQPLSVVSPDQSWNNPATPIVSATTPGGDGSNPISSQLPHQPSSQQSAQQQQQQDPPDADTTLIDTSETTWGIVISHRLNNSPSLTDLNPALASGYLVKRSASPSPGLAAPTVPLPPPIPLSRAGTMTTAEDLTNSTPNPAPANINTNINATNATVPVNIPPPAVMEVNVVYSDSARVVYDGLLREMLTYFRGLGTLARARGVVDREDVRPWHVAVVEKGVRAVGLLM